jgi:hypothetical protein
MTIGIIAEGVTDLMVIRNILYAYGIEKNQIRFIRPNLSEDATDRAKKAPTENISMKGDEFGSWTLVIKECTEQHNINIFFNNIIEDDKILIIQIDSDECSKYGVQEVIPINSLESIEMQRNRIIDKLNILLNNLNKDKIIHAVCIRNIEAWILAMEKYNPQKKETSYYPDPKTRLKETGDRNLRIKSQKEAYEVISNPLTKLKKLIHSTKYNYSLKLFCEDINQYLSP